MPGHRPKHMIHICLEKLMQNQRDSAPSTEADECAGAPGLMKRHRWNNSAPFSLAHEGNTPSPHLVDRAAPHSNGG